MYKLCYYYFFFFYDVTIFFCFFSKDAPDAPDAPQVLAIHHEYAIVSWTDPKDTGGSAITGYFSFQQFINLFIVCAVTMQEYLPCFKF